MSPSLRLSARTLPPSSSKGVHTLSRSDEIWHGDSVLELRRQPGTDDASLRARPCPERRCTASTVRLDGATSRVCVLSPPNSRRTQHARLYGLDRVLRQTNGARSRTPHFRVVRTEERLLDFASSSAFCQTSDKVHLSSMLLRGRHCRGKIEEGRGRPQPRKPRSWATPERFLSSPLSLCSISGHSSVPGDHAYRLLLKACALLPPNPHCHSGRRLPVGQARNNRKPNSVGRPTATAGDSLALASLLYTRHRSGIVRGLDRRRRRVTPWTLKPLRRRDRRAKRLNRGVFSGSAVLLQAVEMLPLSRHQAPKGSRPRKATKWLLCWTQDALFGSLR